MRGDVRGEARGEARGLLDAWAGDRVEGRDSRGASVTGGSRGAGDRGDRGGEGAPEDNCFGGSWPFTFTTGLGFCSSEDFAEPYCKSG